MLHVWNSPNLLWSLYCIRYETHWDVRVDRYKWRTAYLPGERERCDHYAVVHGTSDLSKLDIPKYVQNALAGIFARGDASA